MTLIRLLVIADRLNGSAKRFGRKMSRQHYRIVTNWGTGSIGVYHGFAKVFFKIFREVFASFSQVFASFLRFSELLGPARTCSDAFGWVWMRLDAFGSTRTRS